MTWRLHYVPYLTSLLVEQDGSEGTATAYSTAWAEFLQHVDGRAGLDDVAPAAAAYRRDMRRRGLAQNTVRGRLAAVKSYFRWCHSRKLIPENPLVYFRIPRVERNPREVVTEEALEPVVDRLDELPRNVRLVVALGLYAGLRAGEIRRLRVRDIDMRRLVIKVRDSKGHKDRSVRIVPALAALLEPEFPAPAPACACCGYGRDSYLLIGQRTGSMIARNFAWKTVDRYLDAGPHRLRTTKATFSLEQGVGLEVLAKELGHADINVTSGYGSGRRNVGAQAALDAVEFVRPVQRREKAS